MKQFFAFSLLALAIIGCGEGGPQVVTPEEEAKNNAAMSSDMEKMMGDMKKGEVEGTVAPDATGAPAPDAQIVFDVLSGSG